jgi:centromere protein C
MAPRQSVAGRRNQSSQGDNIYELGVQGRKTGVVLPDTGRRDSKGFELLDDIFSSPEKRSPVRAVANGNRAATTPERDIDEEESDDSSGQDMDIENSTLSPRSSTRGSLSAPLR